MKNTKMVYRLKQIYLFLFVFFFYLYRAISDSNLKFALSFLLLLLSALSGVAYLSLKRKVRSKIAIMLIPFIILVSFVFVKFDFSDTRLIMLFLAGLVFANEDEENVVKIALISRIILTFAIVILFGGFGQRNGIGAHIGTILLLYMCLNKDKLDMKKWLLIFIGVLLLWYINPENAGVIVVLLVALMLQLIRKFNFWKKLLCSKATEFVFPICLFVTWFLSESINATEMPLIGAILPQSVNSAYLGFVRRLNLLLGTRLSLAKTGLNRMGIHVFDANAYFEGYLELLQDAANRNAYFIVDSGYILLLIKWGLLVSVVVCIMSILTMKYYISIRAYNFVIAGIVLAVWSVLEDHIFYSFVLMFWGKAFIELRNIKKERRNFSSE